MQFFIILIYWEKSVINSYTHIKCLLVIIFLLMILVYQVAWLMWWFSHWETNNSHNFLSFKNVGLFMSTAKNWIKFLKHFLMFVFRFFLSEIYKEIFIRNQITFILRTLWISWIEIAFFRFMHAAKRIVKIFLLNIILKCLWFLRIENWQVVISPTIYAILTRYYS